MRKILSISTKIKSPWEKLLFDIKAHRIWNLAPTFHPKVQMRSKSNGGFSFKIENTNFDINMYQTRSVSTGESWNIEEVSSEVLECLEHAYELGIFAKAIIAEKQEADPEACLHDDHSSLPWSMLVPATIRQMVDLGKVKIKYGEFYFKKTNPSHYYDLTFQDNPINPIETFKIESSKYHYSYGKTVHYIRIYNCHLPIITQSAITGATVSKIIDEEIFHHKGMFIKSVEAKGSDIQLNLGRCLYPSGRPPE